MRSVPAMSRRAVAVVTAAVVAGTVVLASALSASASATPHWVAYLTSRADLVDITSTGPRAAWAVADRSAGPSLLRWNGSAWRSEPVPGGRQFLAYQVQVPSDGSVWVTGMTRNGLPRAEVRVDGTWRRVAVPPGTMGMVPLSGSDAWGIDGNDYSCTGSAPPVCETSVWHYTDGSFTYFPVPGTVSQITAAGHRVWVLASEAVYAATGTGLHRIASPGRAGMFPQIAASPSGQLWLLVVYGRSAHKPDSLRSWNGHSWTRRNVPAKAQKLSYGSWGFTWDGSHGVWLGPYTHWTGRRWIRTTPGAPTTAFELLTVTAIPRSASAWAVGTGKPGRYVLALYGARP
jgi:hypothetical protein